MEGCIVVKSWMSPLDGDIGLLRLDSPAFECLPFTLHFHNLNGEFLEEFARSMKFTVNEASPVVVTFRCKLIIPVKRKPPIRFNTKPALSITGRLVADLFLLALLLPPIL